MSQLLECQPSTPTFGGAGPRAFRRPHESSLVAAMPAVSVVAHLWRIDWIVVGLKTRQSYSRFLFHGNTLRGLFANTSDREPRTGYDCKVRGGHRSAPASQWHVEKGDQVPGSAPPNGNAYRLSQILAFIAGRRNEVEAAHERLTEIPQLMGRIAAVPS